MAEIVDTQYIEDPRETGVKGLPGMKANPFRRTVEEQAQIEDFQRSHFGERDLRGFRDEGYRETPTTSYAGTPGLGDSRFDSKMTWASDFDNLTDSRGRHQSGAEQIAFGLLKGAVLAGTTFLDGVVGTPVGLINLAAGGSFINNPWSEAMQSINAWSEEALPNYYRDHELNNPWYKNIFTANFIGDKFLKNVGFTVGAAYAGRINAGMISRVLGMNKIRSAYKGAAEASRQGLTMSGQYSPTAVAENLSRRANTLKHRENILKMTGALSAGMGEARIEAIGNADEYIQEKTAMLDEEVDAWMEAERVKLMQEPGGHQYFNMVQGIDGAMSLELTPEGRAHLYERIRDQHENALAVIHADAARVASVGFAVNTSLLTVSDWIQFGKFYAGGYRVGRRARNIVKDATGQYAAKNTKLIDAAKIMTNPFAEFNEEMMQEVTALGTGYMYNHESYLDAELDPESNEQTMGFLKAMSSAMVETYGDVENWEAGFIGFLTGAMGSPTFRGFQGGIAGTVRESRENRAKTQEMVDQLNKIWTPEAQAYYKALVQNETHERMKEKALDEGDEYTYKNHEMDQLLSSIIAYDEAGRIQDLIDIVEGFGQMESQEDIEQLRRDTVDKETGKSVYDNMTDEQVRESVQNQAKHYSALISQYQDISRDLKVISGHEHDSESLKEISWMMMRVKDWEARFTSMFESLTPELQKSTRVDPETGEIVSLYDLFMESPISFLEGQLREETDRLVQAIGEDLTLSKEAEALQKKIDSYKSKRSKGYKKAVARLDVIKKSIEANDGISVSNINMINQISDMQRMIVDRLIFLHDLNSFINNPAALIEKRKKVKEKAAKNQEALEKTNQKKGEIPTKEALKAAKTLSEFRKILSGHNVQGATPEQLRERRRAIADELSKDGDKYPLARTFIDIAHTGSMITEALSELDSLENQDGTLVYSRAAGRYARTILNFLMERVSDGKDLRDPDNPAIDALASETIDGDPNSPRVFARQEYFGEAASMVRRAIAQVAGVENKYKNPGLTPSNSASRESSQGTQQGNPKPQTKSHLPVKDKPPVSTKKASVKPAKALKGEDQGRVYDGLPGESDSSSREQFADPNQPMAKKNSVAFKKKGERYPRWKPGVSQYEINGMKDKKSPRFIPLKESSPQYSAIWNYLNDKGAFSFVNRGGVKTGDKITFGVDPAITEAKARGIKGIPILMYKGDQVVGTLPNNFLNEQGETDNSHVHLAETIEAIQQEYQDFLNASTENSNKMFMSSFSTTVSDVLPGRMMFTNNFVRDLSEVSEVFDHPMTFAMSVGGTIQVPNVSDSHLDVGVTNPAKRDGGLWLRVKGADGRYYYASVTVKHFNESEFSLASPRVQRTGAFKSIQDILGRIYDSEIHGKGSTVQALNELQGILYFDGDLHMYYNPQGEGYMRLSLTPLGQEVDENTKEIFSDRIVVGRTQHEETHISAEGVVGETTVVPGDLISKEEFVQTMMESLQIYNPRFQVSARRINVEGYNESLAADGILQTRLQSVIPGSAWFWTNPVNAKGEIQQIDYSDTKKAPPTDRRLTDTRGSNPVGGTETVAPAGQVRFKGGTYNVDSQGRVIGPVSPRNRGVIEDMALIKLATQGKKVPGSSVNRNPGGQTVRLKRPDGSVAWFNLGLKKGDEVISFISAEKANQLERKFQEATRKKTQKVQARPTTLQNTLRIVDQIRENTRSLVVSTDEKAYVDVRTKKQGVVDEFTEGGVLIINPDHYEKSYQRVTDWMDPRDVPDTPLIRSALHIGTRVDEIMRDFFDGVDVIERADWYEVADQKILEGFVAQLRPIKEAMDARGETPISEELTLHDDNVGIAGTVDLITYDKSGAIRIYDFKTMRGNQLRDRTPEGNTKYDQYNRVKHQKQLSSYRMLLHNTYGLLAESLSILPIEISYNAGDTSTKVLRLLPNSQKDGVVERFIPHDALPSIKGKDGQVLELREHQPVEVEEAPSGVAPAESQVQTTFDPIVYGEDKSGVKGWEPRVVVSWETHRIQWGKSVKIEGFEGYDFFITEDSKGYYTVYEASTGRNIVPQHRGSQRSVLAIAKQRLDEIGHEKVAEVIGESNKGYDKLDAQALYDSTQGSSQEAQVAEVTEVAEVTTPPQEAGTQEDNKKNKFMGIAGRVGLKVNPDFAPRQQTQATEGVFLGDTFNPNPNASFEAFAQTFPETAQRKGFTKQIWDKLSPQEKIHEINCAIPF